MSFGLRYIRDNTLCQKQDKYHSRVHFAGGSSDGYIDNQHNNKQDAQKS